MEYIYMHRHVHRRTGSKIIIQLILNNMYRDDRFITSTSRMNYIEELDHMYLRYITS